jgi:pentatricopeptide repeat protein
VQDAREVFFRVPSKDVIAWNAMISGYAALDHFQAIHAFNQMQYHRLMPNASTCVSVLDTCAKNMDLDEGKRIHAFVVNNKIEQDVILQTAIMNMYGKCGDVSTACDMFANIRKRSLITWNTIISICAQNGRIGEAIRILKEMQESRVKPNSVTFIGVLDACSESISLDEGQWIHSSVVEAGVDFDSNLGSALINMYGKCGLLENAWNIFETLSEKSVILITTFMSVLAKHGLADRVFQLLCIMHEKRIKPNHVTFINVLTACNHDGLVKGAYRWFSAMYNDYEVTPLVDHYICLVDILGRAALLDEAERLVDIMPFQSPWLSLLHLLGACRQQMDTERGYRVATRLLELDSVDPSPYVIMSNMYAIADQDFDDAR